MLLLIHFNGSNRVIWTKFLLRLFLSIPNIKKFLILVLKTFYLRFLICITLIKRFISICLLLHSLVDFIHYDCHQWYIHQMIKFCFSQYRSTKRFGPDGERFEHLAFLNLAQNVVCLIWSYISEFHSIFIFWLFLLLKCYL